MTDMGNSGPVPDGSLSKDDLRKGIEAIAKNNPVFHSLFEAAAESTGLPEFYERICPLLLRVPCITFVWVGLLDEGTREVLPIMQGGMEEGYLNGIKIMADDSTFALGPTGQAIRTGRCVVANDILGDPKYAAWHEKALKRGYRSSAAIPFQHRGKVNGALNVYSDRKDAFGESEVRSLQEIGNGLALIFCWMYSEPHSGRPHGKNGSGS